MLSICSSVSRISKILYHHLGVSPKPVNQSNQDSSHDIRPRLANHMAPDYRLKATDLTITQQSWMIFAHLCALGDSTGGVTSSPCVAEADSATGAAGAGAGAGAVGAGAVGAGAVGAGAAGAGVSPLASPWTDLQIPTSYQPLVQLVG